MNLKLQILSHLPYWQKLVFLKKSKGLIATDEILVAIGRKPNISKLGLDKVKIKCDKNQAIIVNKNLEEVELIDYLSKIETKTLLAYGVYQIEADGLELFEYIKGDKDSIMGLPIKQIMNYIKQYKK